MSSLLSRTSNTSYSIPKRRELVKEAARNPTAAEIKETRQEQQDHLWNNDPLSQRPLSRPVVSDSLGRLFNKDSIIEFLLPADDANASKRTEQEALLQGLVKSLKDVVEVIFEVDEAATEVAKARRDGGHRSEKWICPITRQELGAGSKAVYLVPCGHAFSGIAVKEVAGSHCTQCNEAYAPNDVIPILSVVEMDVTRLTLRQKTLKEKSLAHSLKKIGGATKKRKQNGAQSSVEANGTLEPLVPVRVSGLKEINKDGKIGSKASTPQPRSGTSTPRPLGIQNAATASLTARVLEEQEARNKRRKIDKNDNIESLFSSSNASEHKKGRDIDFMNRGFALASSKR